MPLTERDRKIASIRQTIEEYINGNPEISTFRFFLPSLEDGEALQQAFATVSLKTGKPIDLIYPTGIEREEQG